MQGKKILVIDDDVTLARSLRLALSKAGAQVFTAADGAEGMRQFYEHRPDLVILDVIMPAMDGWETCRQLRLLSNVPIIMLTTLQKEDAIIRGLDYGADDFISKPFSAGVLLARARAALRRGERPDRARETAVHQDAHLEIDLVRTHVAVRGRIVHLTATEFRLLSFLVQNKDQVLRYEQILVYVWGWEYRDNVEYIHVYISRLRQKLEVDPKNPRYFLTERGLGYRFASGTGG